MADKRMTEEEVVAELEDGMTIGIGGWGSRRKPMSIVRAILRSPLKDLTVVSYAGPDLYFDDLFLSAATKRFMSVERIVPTGRLLDEGTFHTLRVNRLMVDGVVEAPNGAHFTSCAPDYERDESFQREYAATAKSPEAWDAFRSAYLDVDGEAEYQRAVTNR